MALASLLLVCTGLLATAGQPAAATPATLYSSANGSGTFCNNTTPCSLTEALNLVAPGGTVVLATSGVAATQSTHYIGNFTVGTGGTSAALPVTIEPGPRVVNPILDGHGSGTVLTVNSGVYVTVAGVTITGGSAGDEACGGILNAGTVTVENSTISGNTASAEGGHTGGGIANLAGTVTMENSTISGNMASILNGAVGGGILNTGTVSIGNSTISGNMASNNSGNAGGGIANLAGTFTMENSTISGNMASILIGAVGGGILNGGTVGIESSTISGNTASNMSGDSVGGGGLFDGSGTDSASLTATIVALNTGGDCFGSWVQGVHAPDLSEQQVGAAMRRCHEEPTEIHGG